MLCFCETSGQGRGLEDIHEPDDCNNFYQSQPEFRFTITFHAKEIKCNNHDEENGDPKGW